MKPPGRLLFRVTFGLLAIIIGAAIIVWICYNEFIDRRPQYTGTHWWEPFGVAPAMIGIGVYWLRGVREPDKMQNQRIARRTEDGRS